MREGEIRLEIELERLKHHHRNQRVISSSPHSPVSEQEESLDIDSSMEVLCVLEP